MALNFPDSPTLNQIYTDNVSGFSYQWNGTVWISFSPASTGNIRVLDDISGSFNGSTQTFALTSSSVAISPPNPQSVIVNLGGVVQDPSDDYTVSGSNIIFSTAPASGLSFSGVVLGVVVPVGVSTGDAFYRQIYSPTGVQTSFTFINGYTVGYLDVYRNGSKLVPALQYTATDGVNFSLVTPAQSGDNVEAIGYKVSSVAIVDGAVNSLIVSGIATVVGATNLGSTLNVSGVTTVSGATNLGSTLGVTGATNLNSTLNVTGVTTISGATNLGNNLNVSGIATVAGSTNLSRLSVSGVATVSGATNLGSTLNVTGVTTVSGATNLGSTLGVTGATNLSSTLGVSGATNLNSTLIVSGVTTISGAANLGSTLGVTGATNLSSTLGVTGATNLNSTLNVSGISTLGSVRIASGIVSATSGVVTYYGDGSNLNLTGNTTAGVSSTSSVNTVGVVTAGIFDGFIAADQKVVSANLTINNNQENISFAEDLVIGTGVTFTVSAGSTVRMDALNVINSSVLSASVDLDIPNGTISQRPSAPTAGSFRYNSDGNFLEFYDGTSWRGVVLTSVVSNPSDTGVFGGGYVPSTPSGQLGVRSIQYITISSTGNATDFGALTEKQNYLAACSSSTRGVFGGGTTPTNTSTIGYINIATTGSATYFGDLTRIRGKLAACSSSTRGVFGGGYTPVPVDTRFNIIDYITISSSGDAIDFGDLSTTREGLAACSSSTRGVFGGGRTPTVENTIEYITIATTGNTTDFGDLTVTRFGLASCSSSTRGVFGGGNPAPLNTNVIDFITIATTGNATDFGDLTLARFQLAACSSSTRGIFGGGSSPTVQNVMDSITIATTGNAIDFGDLSVSRAALAACSSGHGGLS